MSNLAAAWMDVSGRKIRVGALDPSGDNAWTADGEAISSGLVSSNTANQILSACSDGSGGMYVAFFDLVSTSGPYIQRVDSYGAVASGWPVGGVRLSTQAVPTLPSTIRVVPDVSGGAIVAWPDARNGDSAHTVFAQRVDSAGVVQWTTDGVNLKSPSSFTRIAHISMDGDGSGGAYVAWGTSANSAQLQYVNAAGSVQFGAGGLGGSFTGGGTGSIPTQGVHVLNSGDGCFLLVNSATTRLRRFTTTGATYSGWSASGTSVGTGGLSDASGAMVLDGSGGVVCFSYRRSGSSHNIAAQRVNGAGVVQWVAPGALLVPGATTSSSSPQMGDLSPVAAGGGAVIAWRKGPWSSSSQDVYCVRLDGAGTHIFSTAVCSLVGAQSLPSLCDDGHGGYYVAWTDDRDGTGDLNVYAQRLDAAGSPMWAADGVVVSDRPLSQAQPQIVATDEIVVAPPPASPDSRAGLMQNIRYLIDDLDKNDYAISSLKMVAMMNGAMQTIAARMLVPMEDVLDIDLVSGQYDYTLSGLPGDIRSIYSDVTGRDLEPMRFDDMASEFKQDTSLACPQGRPLYYALHELSSQAVKVRVAPTPSTLASFDTLKVRYSLIPNALSLETSTVPFPDVLLRAMERRVAAECVASMTQAQRDRRRLGMEQVREWLEMVEMAIREENFRQRVASGSTQDRIVEVTDQWR